MLNEKHYKLIELLISGEHTIVDACKMAGIDRNTYYWLLKGESKTGKEFNKAYEGALDLKVKESRKFVKSKVNDLLGSLIKIIESGRNENARVNAVAKLLTYAELDPQFKQEVTIKAEDQDSKNALLDMLKKKQQENEEEDE